MAKQTINIGTSANDGTGDSLRSAFDKSNDNFTELYNGAGGVADGAITTAKLAADAVDGTKIADDSIDSEHYVDGSIDTVHISNDAVTADKVDSDLRAVQYIGIDTGDYIEFTADTQLDVYVNGSNEFRFEADGDFHADGDVIAFSTTVASDNRLKENVKVIDNPLEKLEQLKGVTFDWVNRDNKKSGGVIAQELQKVLPDLVKEVDSLNKDDKFLAVDYNGVIALLIEAVKELNEKCNNCKNK